MGILKKVQKYIVANELLQPGERVLVGVSGGADSVVLLNILLKSGYECIAAHCNFHLRGNESDRDERFVENLSGKYGILYKKHDFDTVGYARSRKISIEMAARELRYRWFNKIAGETGANVIAVAHHADDSVETALLNLVRGTGLKGLTGIDAKNGNIVRPLLGCFRNEIERYAQKHNLPFVFDSTNAANDYIRNKIRNRVIPVLSEINPSVRQTIYEDTLRLKGAWSIYRAKIEEIKAAVVSEKERCAYIDIKLLKSQADLTAVLFEMLNEYGFNADVVENIATGIDGNPGLIFVSQTHRLLKDRDALIIEELETANESEYPITVDTKETTEPVRLTFNRLTNSPDFQVSKSKDVIHIDADKLDYPLTIRKWRKGDVFQPFGMNRSKKVSDFFIDSKLNLFQKEETWLLVSGEKIVWIIGLRPDNRFRITKNTKNIVEISCKSDFS